MRGRFAPRPKIFFPPDFSQGAVELNCTANEKLERGQRTALQIVWLEPLGHASNQRAAIVRFPRLKIQMRDAASG